MDRRAFLGELGILFVAAKTSVGHELQRGYGQWSLKPASQRVLDIQNNTLPILAQPVSELIRATAEEFHAMAKSNLNPSQLAEKVRLATAEQLAQGIQSDQNRELTAAEYAVAKQYLEAYVHSSEQILVNEEANRRAADRKNFGLSREAAQIAFLKSTLFHAFGHAVQTKERITLQNPIPVTIERGVVTFTAFERMHFQGIDSAGKPFYLGGGGEALTETIGSITARRTAPYLVTDGYKSGFNLVSELNKHCGISEGEFVQYYQGQRPLSEMFRRWQMQSSITGQGIDPALHALMAITLHVNYGQGYDLNTTRNDIQKTLNLQA